MYSMMPYSVGQFISKLDYPQDHWDAFHYLFSETAKKHSPMIRKRVKGRDYLRENNTFHHVMDIRDRAKVKAKQTRWIEDLENYKTHN